MQRKISELKREITQIQARKTREVARRNQDYFTVCLVGYTNAGKSTLFNTVTEASGGGGAYADDKLFATLSTRTRKWDLGGGDAVMLSDTVGFVRNLPHHLVASFRATLEESVHADLLLIVLDAAHPRAMQRLETVMQVLKEIGAGDRPRLIVLNKIDVVQYHADLVALQNQHPDSMAISARTGRGVHELVEYVRSLLHGQQHELTLSIPLADGKAINYLENRAQVLDRQYDSDRVTMTVRIGQRQLDQLRSMGSSIELPDDAATAKKGWGR